MNIPLLAGRFFSDDLDSRTSPHVLIVNEVFARTFFGKENPVGKTVRTVGEPGFPSSEFQIVGVVKDTKYGSLRDPVPPRELRARHAIPARTKSRFRFCPYFDAA